MDDIVRSSEFRVQGGNTFDRLFGSGVISAVSSRQDGNMSLNYGDTTNSLENRKNFLNSLGIDYRGLVCAQQAHGNTVRYIKKEDKGSGALSYDTAIADTDAFVTDNKDVPLAIFTADCLSVFLYDPLRPAIGVVHAGWRSSREEIALETVKFMQDKFNSNPEKLLVGLGPAMRKCCYEVTEDSGEFFPYGLEEINGVLHLDLIAVNKKQLLSCGVKETNITDCGKCTFCGNKELFSFRKEKDNCGRMMSVVMLK